MEILIAMPHSDYSFHNFGTSGRFCFVFFLRTFNTEQMTKKAGIVMNKRLSPKVPLCNRREFQRWGLATGIGLKWGFPFRAAMAVSQSPIPELERWETQMVQFGRDHCQLLTDMDEPLDSLLDATYYDALRVYLRVAEYTGEAPWGTCADHALRIYRDRFVLPKQGQVPGYWVFPHGLSLHYQQTKDAKSREAVLLLAQNSPFTKENTNASAAQAAERSRETAYAISSLLAAEVLGAPRRPRLRLLVDHALDHIDQWFVSRTAAYVRPFMFALTAEALIAYEAQTQDRRILKAIQTGADFLWDRLWVSEAEAFRYTDRATDTGGTSPAPDLNLLIAPLFGWLGARTGQERFWERGDAIFAGGVRHAWLGRPKQYHQNYRWSFDYVQWRQAQPD